MLEEKKNYYMKKKKIGKVEITIIFLKKKIYSIWIWKIFTISQI